MKTVPHQLASLSLPSHSYSPRMDIPELANFTPRQPLASTSSQSFPLDPQLISQPSSSSRNYWDEDQDPLEYQEEEEGEGEYASASQEGESEEETDAEEEFAQSQIHGKGGKRTRQSQGGLLLPDGRVESGVMDKGKGKEKAVERDGDVPEEGGEDLGLVRLVRSLSRRRCRKWTDH